MADQFVLQQSIEDNQHDFLFTKKQWIATTDSNSGNYNQGQVIFDLSNIANSGQYINFLESYIHIPLVHSVQFTGDTNAAYLLKSELMYKNNLMASLKNGSYQIIHSLNVKLGNNEIVSIVPFQNLKINYDILTKWSDEDVKKCGPSLHFAKETGDTASFSVGIGSNNNKVHGANADRTLLYSKYVPDTVYGCLGNQVNTGRLERMLRTNVAFDDAQISPYMTFAKAQLHGKDCCEIKTTTPATLTNPGVNVLNFYINATIKLTDIHDYFNNCPLMKNGWYQLVFNMNVNSVVSYYLNGTGGTSVYSVTGATPTIPFQLSQGLGAINQATSGTVKSSLTICKPTEAFTTGSTNVFTSCKLYACLMTFAPAKEIEYLQNPVRNIKFMDTFCQNGGNLSGVAPEGNIQVSLSGQYVF